jgi:hypothetical protein
LNKNKSDTPLPSMSPGTCRPDGTGVVTRSAGKVSKLTVCAETAAGTHRTARTLSTFNHRCFCISPPETVSILQMYALPNTLGHACVIDMYYLGLMCERVALGDDFVIAEAAVASKLHPTTPR